MVHVCGIYITIYTTCKWYAIHIMHCLLLICFPLQISLSLSSSLRSEAQAEKYKDLRALLQLLTNISSKDLVSYFFFLVKFVILLFLLLILFDPIIKNDNDAGRFFIRT